MAADRRSGKRAEPFYLSEAWRAFRAAVLRERPGCEVPGCGRRASHVDHVKARRAGGASLDRANVQALCASHHSQKTAARDGGFGNPTRRGAHTFTVPGCDADGNPVDPAHGWNRGRR